MGLLFWRQWLGPTPAEMALFLSDPNNPAPTNAKESRFRPKKWHTMWNISAQE